ncbi:hypothetical protein FRC11_008156 [Ceratobasidium sp. 423]|nr:hypothetical protein FRC11_008156 [Ceratobasidium sp. 423]
MQNMLNNCWREARVAPFGGHVTQDQPAWGGYYASFLHEPDVPQPNGSIIPEQALSDYTQSQLKYLRFTDSIMIDPHKSGKPGAAAVSTWLSHHMIGLHKHRYGSFLSESLFSCAKIYTHWATMDMDNSKLILVPLKAIPTERQKLSSDAICKQHEYIHNNIVN